MFYVLRFLAADTNGEDDDRELSVILRPYGRKTAKLLFSVRNSNPKSKPNPNPNTNLYYNPNPNPDPKPNPSPKFLIL